MTIRIMCVALTATAIATTTSAQTTDDGTAAPLTIDCALPANAELQECIDLAALGATGLIPALVPLGAIAGIGLLGAGGGGGGGGGGGSTPTTSGTGS